MPLLHLKIPPRIYGFRCLVDLTVSHVISIVPPFGEFKSETPSTDESVGLDRGNKVAGVIASQLQLSTLQPTHTRLALSVGPEKYLSDVFKALFRYVIGRHSVRSRYRLLCV